MILISLPAGLAAELSMSGAAGLEGGFSLEATIDDFFPGVATVDASFRGYECPSFEPVTATLSWCERAYEEEESCALSVTKTYRYNDCYAGCRIFDLDEATCEENCAPFLETEEVCVPITVEAAPQCGFTAVCDAEQLSGCLDACADEGVCVDLCYQGACPAFQEASEPINIEPLFQEECFETHACEDPLFDTTSLRFPLERFGDAWKGSLAGTALEAGKQYYTELLITDVTGLDHVMPAGTFYSALGYDVTLGVENCRVTGTVIDTNGAPLKKGRIELLPSGERVPIMANGLFGARIVAGEEVTARYTPNPACERFFTS